jgi:galactonate dehydratase
VKVTHLDVFPVQAGWRTWVFIRLRTDDGIEGWGEATTVFADAALLGALEDLREFVIGVDPTRIEEFWSNRFYRTIFHGPTFYSAVASIEHALWDITGKSLGVPVHQLIGGAIRDEARLYANTWFLGARTPGEYAAKAAAVVTDGWDALKFDPLPGSLMAATRQELQVAVDRVEAVRDAVGPDVDILIECHGRLSPESAIRFADVLAPYRPYWIEEPVPAHNPPAMRRVRERTDIAVASGERLSTRWGYRELLEVGAVDIVQPDVTQCGGLLESRRVADLAARYGVSFAPHCPRGPVATAVGLQLAVTTPNFLILEYPLDIGGVDWRQELVTSPERIEGGRMARPTAPGLGVEMIEAELVKHRADHFIREIPGYYEPDFTIT